ncbi:hypothetical protein JCM11641_004070 [Rhodosporidiobolus odoratus]
MQADNASIKRESGDLEGGAVDVLPQEVRPRQASPLTSPPSWQLKWEKRRPTLLAECLAEMIGAFFYVYSRVRASAAFLVTSAARMEGYGSLLTIALAYAFGIAFAIIIAAPTSGGHLSPSFTIAFTLFKGFPLRKIPFFIASQLLGGFFACLCVYIRYKQQLDDVSHAFALAGQSRAVFSTNGPAGIFAPFPQPGQNLGHVFFNEFMAHIFLSILVFSVLVLTNAFVSFTTIPFVIASGHSVIIAGFAVDSVSLNVARDVGRRLRLRSGYTALAALTTFPATLLGALIHTRFLSDNNRMIVNYPRQLHEQISAINEQRGFSTPGRPISSLGVRESIRQDSSGEKV